MASKLTPAQRAVLEAMAGGAEIERELSCSVFRLKERAWWRDGRKTPEFTLRTFGALEANGLICYLAANTANTDVWGISDAGREALGLAKPPTGDFAGDRECVTHTACACVLARQAALERVLREMCARCPLCHGRWHYPQSVFDSAGSDVHDLSCRHCRDARALLEKR